MGNQTFALPDLTPLQINQECYFNLYKSVYGFKPRGILTEDQWNDVDFLDGEIDKLAKMGEV